jgi:hypothetical protein
MEERILFTETSRSVSSDCEQETSRLELTVLYV